MLADLIWIAGKILRAKREVLIAEDNPADVYLLQFALKEANADCDITVAHDGEEAMRLLAHADPLPDLVVLDLNLPRKDGLEVLTEMRRNIRLLSIPVVVLTSSEHPRDAQHVNELQASAFLIKPNNLDDYLKLGDVITSLWRKCDEEPI